MDNEMIARSVANEFLVSMSYADCSIPYDSRRLSD